MLTIAHLDILKIIKIGPTDDINESVGVPKKNFSINFNKSKTKFCLSLHYNGDAIYLYVNKTQIFKFNRIDISPYLFCLGRVSKGFTKDAVKNIALSGVYMVFQLITE